MKRHRTAVIFGAFPMLVACGIWIVADFTPDPVNAGKRASEWLFEPGCGDNVREQQATNAFSELGTKALPVLNPVAAALVRRVALRPSHLRIAQARLVSHIRRAPQHRLQYAGRGASHRCQ